MLPCRIRILSALDPFRGELECPCDYQRDWKTKRRHKNDKPNRPVRNFQKRKNLRGDLNQKPADDSVRDGHLVNVAPLQLAEESLRIHRTSLLAPIFGRE